ncbi:uncharacterized protein LOC123699812 isoform X1 [Colias croceus]|uniref:uncharacterized protein LOC123699812 isoform X1 n=1 Tax=Colias crocea TaxID=72248 RepID=UPI001E27F5C6|nr:uncharacterized protein LOC123699812 isoform X1 [Colias croceus]
MEYIKEQLPDLNKNYNPNHGYEPYWPGGDWVFKDPELGPNETTTKVPLVCGEECNYLYTRIGAVCARQANNVDYERCSGIWIGFCLGYRYDEFHRGFYTFDTYCKFLDAQCRTGFKDRWLLVHKGNCSHNLDKYFKPVYTPGVLFTRLSTYFPTLIQAFEGASLPPPLRKGTEDIVPNSNIPKPVRLHINNVLQNALSGRLSDE